MSLLVSSSMSCGHPCSFLSKVSLQLMGRQGLSFLSIAVDMVEMSLSLLVEEFVGHVLVTLLISLGVGELGIDMEKDVLVSVSAWISVDLGCWSVGAAV